MKIHPIALGMLLSAALLTGCVSRLASSLSGDPDIQDAADDMEESRLDYESCLKDQEDEFGLNCDDWKDIYEDDQDAYERLVKRQQAQRG
ncbi:hypothetical protein [Methylomagnum sp.]